MTNIFQQYGQGERTLSSSGLPFFKKILALPAYHWLLLSVGSVVFPHILGIPSWILALLIFSVFMQKPAIKAWINRISRGKLKKIYQGIQLSVFLLGTLFVWFGFNQTFGIDVAVSFLALCFIAKLWEFYQKRDGYILVNLALFVLASAFLVQQNLSTAILALPSLLLLLTTYIALSDEHNDTGVGRLRSLGMITLPAIPLLVVLFVFFPRIAPLWVLPMAGKKASTGVSDSMSPGDFSNLSQSTSLAFRAEFDGTLPKRQDMYWRGLVFSDFDGVTWRQSEFSPNFWSSRDGANPPDWAKSAYGGTSNAYTVTLEPTEQNWLFGLDYPRLNGERGVGLSSDFTLRTYYPVSTQRRYRTSFYSNRKIDVVLTDLQRRINLRLPQSGNERSISFAKSLFAQNNQDPVQYIKAIENFIKTEGFSYTLQPPVLNKNRVDEFLFGTKSGFCEHYASSFAFLMRAVGIPARIVAGYQGGELGRDGVSWEVRQMDAHAWTEVWLEGEGWVRVDPTAFISPNRIQNGMNALAAENSSTLFGDDLAGQLGYSQFRLLQTLRSYSDQASYYWQSNVVGYDQDEQKNSLFKWFNITSMAQQFWVLVVSFVLLSGVFVVVMYFRRRKIPHPLDKPLINLSKKLQKQDASLAIGASEPYLTWLDRISANVEPSQAGVIDEIKALYRQYRFGKNEQASMTKQKQVGGAMGKLTQKIHLKS